MIKRRFYQLEHKDGNEASSASSSSDSSGSEIDAFNDVHGSSSDSEIEDNSCRDDGDDATILKCEKKGSEVCERTVKIQPLKEERKTSLETVELPAHIMKIKSVYRCRICPKVICLNDESLKSHISSKKHLRSERLLKDNKLREMLNSDGELENQETPAELHARIVALAQSNPKQKRALQNEVSVKKVKSSGKKARF